MKPGLLSDIPPTELAWLAGVLEGEGSFIMSRNTVNKKLYLYPKIVVSMTDQDVIRRVCSLFETSVYVVPKDKRGDWKQQYRASIQGARAASLMQQLLPWMGERRSAKILDILSQYGTIEPTEVRRRRSCQEAYKKRTVDNKGRFV